MPAVLSGWGALQDGLRLQANEHWRLQMLWTGMSALRAQCKLRRIANKGLQNLMSWRLSRAWASWVGHVQVRGCSSPAWGLQLHCQNPQKAMKLKQIQAGGLVQKDNWQNCQLPSHLWAKMVA